MCLIRKRPQPRGFCSPASFALDVGRLGVGRDGAGQRAVGDPDDDSRRRSSRRRRRRARPGWPWLPYSMAFIAASLTAVLSRSRRAGGRPRSATAAATRSIAIALVALVAGDRERGEQRRSADAVAVGSSATPDARRRVTSVMSSSCSQSGPVNRVERRRAGDRAARCRRRPRRIASRRRGKPYISLAGSCASTSPSRVEQDVAARVDDPLGLLVADAGHAGPAACRSRAAR